MKMVAAVASVGAMLALAGTAFAGTPTVFSFNFQNLSGSFSTGTSQFAAIAESGPSQINSVGSVSRTASPGSTASFDAGFVAGIDPSNFQLNLGVSNTLGFNASGFGSFLIVDKDGDTLSGTVSGDRTLGMGFTQSGPTVFYFGALSNVIFTPFPASGNTTWDGPNGGSFDFTTLPGGPIFSGAIVELHMNTSGTPFWTTDWGYNGGQGTPVPVGVNAELVPAPGAAALLGLGGLIAGRRRRTR